MPIIDDDAVKPEFGTGALKVTPAHDPADYDIGQRHGLPMITVIATDGTMDVPDLPQFHGLSVDAARVAVTEALRAAGAVVKEEPYVHEVGHCDRSGDVLEPLISIIPVIQKAYPYLPGAAAGAITGASRGNLAHLDALQGGLVLLGWGLLFAVAGWMLTIRRDIP